MVGIPPRAPPLDGVGRMRNGNTEANVRKRQLPESGGRIIRLTDYPIIRLSDCDTLIVGLFSSEPRSELNKPTIKSLL